MYEKFLELPQEKRQRIINAGMEAFGKQEYKHALTDDIAAKAGISKGLLFYYFQNKKSLYLYLYQYCGELLQDLVIDDEFTKITDFFEMMEYGAERKLKLLQEYPFIMDFVMQSFYSQNEAVSEAVTKQTEHLLQSSFTTYLRILISQNFVTMSILPISIRC